LKAGGGNPAINLPTVIQAEGADVYNATLTGDTAPTVTSATGISNASGPKVMGFKANQSAEAHGLGIQEEVSPTLEGGGAMSEVSSTLLSKGISGTQGGQGAETIIMGQQVMSWCGDTTPKAAEDVSVTLRSQQGGEGVGVAANMIVRRLTPTECERLQGFPDHWTEEREELELIDNQWHATPITHPQADGPRYKQLGNAVTVNVARWIGSQLQKQHIEFSDNQSPIHKNAEKQELKR